MDRTTTTANVRDPFPDMDPVLASIAQHLRTGLATSDPIIARLCVVLVALVERIDVLVKTPGPQKDAPPPTE